MLMIENKKVYLKIQYLTVLLNTKIKLKLNQIKIY